MPPKAPNIRPTPDDHERAVLFLAREIPPEVLTDVRMVMQNKQTPWHHASHFGLGLQVRNALREAGFTWDDVWLDGHWYELVEAAAQRTTNAQTNSAIEAARTCPGVAQHRS